MLKLKTSEAQSVIDSYVAGEKAASIAKRLNVARATVTMIISGETWQGLRRPVNLKELAELRRCHKFDIPRLPELTIHQKNIIIGSLLGDGWLSKAKGKYRDARFNKQQKQMEHIEWMRNELIPYSLPIHPRIAKEKPMICDGKIKHIKTAPFVAGYLLYTTTNKIFTDMWEVWYANGIKTPPRNLKLNPEVLAIWYVDDGSDHYRACKLCTHGFSFNDADFLIHTIKKDLDIKGSVVKDKYLTGRKPAIYFYGDNYDKFIETVKPYIVWDCFRYKVRKISYKKSHEHQRVKDDTLTDGV